MPNASQIVGKGRNQTGVHVTSGRRKSSHVALSHPSHPQPLGTTHIRLSHPMRFKSPHFLQNTMGTELEGRCCQPQEFTAHCTHMLKTHWFGFMLNAFPGQNPIGHTAIKGFLSFKHKWCFLLVPPEHPTKGLPARVPRDSARVPRERRALIPMNILHAHSTELCDFRE